MPSLPVGPSAHAAAVAASDWEHITQPAQHAASRVRLLLCRRTAHRWQYLGTRGEFVLGGQPLRDVRCRGRRLSLPPRAARKHLHVPDRCVPKLPRPCFIRRGLTGPRTSLWPQKSVHTGTWYIYCIKFTIFFCVFSFLNKTYISPCLLPVDTRRSSLRCVRYRLLPLCLARAAHAAAAR
jgi:hypothetical protein